VARCIGNIDRDRLFRIAFDKKTWQGVLVI